MDQAELELEQTQESRVYRKDVKVPLAEVVSIFRVLDDTFGRWTYQVQSITIVKVQEDRLGGDLELMDPVVVFSAHEFKKQLHPSRVLHKSNMYCFSPMIVTKGLAASEFAIVGDMYSVEAPNPVTTPRFLPSHVVCRVDVRIFNEDET